MIEKSFNGYKVYKIKNGKKLYVGSIYNNKINFVYDYTHARTYKTKEQAEKIFKKVLTR